MGSVDLLVQDALKNTHESLSKELNSDVILYSGPMGFETPHIFKEVIKTFTRKKRTLSIILTTGGGPVEPVERAVEIIRKSYVYVNFIVPDYAMSAGTIFCMSGDKIYMNQASSLGPIDPQVQKRDGTFIPAIGYLEKFEELVEKSKTNDISPAEIDLLRKLDLGDLSRYEQARNLTVTLLKKWLVNYKFKNWKIHGTTPEKKGKPVTIEEKNDRAEDIAKKLNNIAMWHSHGRHICIDTLRKELKLKIENYTNRKNLAQHIEQYHGIAVDYISKNDYFLYVHAGRAFSVLRRQR